MKTEEQIRQNIKKLQAELKTLDRNDVAQYFKIKEIKEQISAYSWVLQ